MVNHLARQNFFRNPFRKGFAGSSSHETSQMLTESAKEPIAPGIIQRWEFELIHHRSPLDLAYGPINPGLGPLSGKLKIIVIFP